MSKLLINQSLVKDLVKYQAGDLCGLIFNNKWINEQYAQGSKANRLGHYFEFLCTGALAKGETSPPKPDLTKKGEITTEFQMAQKQADYFKEVIYNYGIKISGAGTKVIAEDKWVGTLDIEAKWDKLFEEGSFEKDPSNPENKVIIDLKYSALIDDKWSPFGWDIDTLPTKQGTMLQAKHYKFLFWKKYGFNPPFFFFVFDSKKSHNCKIIYVDISIEDLEEHELFLNKAKIYLNQQLEIGFKPLPSYEACSECSYKKWCLYKEDTPPIITIKPN